MGDGRCPCSWVVSEPGNHSTQSIIGKNGARLVKKKKIDWRGCHLYVESEKKNYREEDLIEKREIDRDVENRCYGYHRGQVNGMNWEKCL